MNVLLKKYSFSDDNCHEFRLGLAAVESCFAKPRYIRLGKKVTLNMDAGNILYKRQEPLFHIHTFPIFHAISTKLPCYTSPVLSQPAQIRVYSGKSIVVCGPWVSDLSFLFSPFFFGLTRKPELRVVLSQWSSVLSRRLFR
jgi:hypothetical protein